MSLTMLLGTQSTVARSTPLLWTESAAMGPETAVGSIMDVNLVLHCLLAELLPVVMGHSSSSSSSMPPEKRLTGVTRKAATGQREQLNSMMSGLDTAVGSMNASGGNPVPTIGPGVDTQSSTAVIGTSTGTKTGVGMAADLRTRIALGLNIRESQTAGGVVRSRATSELCNSSSSDRTQLTGRARHCSSRCRQVGHSRFKQLNR